MNVGKKKKGGEGEEDNPCPLQYSACGSIIQLVFARGSFLPFQLLYEMY